MPLREPRSSTQSVAVAVERARVHLRDERVERERHRATAAAAERDLAVDRERRARFGRGLDEHEPPRLAAACRGVGGGLRRGAAPGTGAGVPRSSRATIQTTRARNR